MSDKKTIECRGNNILFLIPTIEEKTEGGIIKSEEMIAAEQADMDSKVLEVLSVGEDVKSIKKGDKVLIGNPQVPIYTIDGIRYGGAKEYDVFAVVN